MPRVYRSVEEQRRAKAERDRKKDYLYISSVLRNAIKESDYTYEQLSAVTKISKGTIVKAVAHPEEMKLSTINKLFLAIDSKTKIGVVENG